MKLNFICPLGIAAILLLGAVFCQGQEFDGVKKDTTNWKDTVAVVLLVFVHGLETLSSIQPAGPTSVIV